MKVLFVLGFPNPFPGAGWTRIGFIANHFAMKGHFVVLLGAFSYRSMDRAGAKNEGQINLRNINFTLGLGHPAEFLSNMALSFLTSAIFLVLWRPKVVIVTLPREDIGLGCIAASFFLRKKIIIDYCDEWEDYAISLAHFGLTKSFYSLVKKVSSYFYQRALVACVTPDMSHSLVKRGVEKIVLIPNGVDTNTFRPTKPRTRHDKEFKIFFSGTVGAYYRLDLIIRALERIESHVSMNVKLIIAGQGDVGTILSCASEAGVRGSVEYVGTTLDKKQLSEMLADADVGIVPYDDNPLWKNTIPLKFLEYCACGLPVIATAHGDSFLAELIKQNQIGLICEPFDVVGLAKAIERLAKDEDFRESAGKRARLMVERSFDMNNIATDFLNIVRKAAEP